MSRPVWVYLLMAAVVAAAGGLAYYGYRYSRELSVRERAVILDTMRELAEEKIIGIESELIKSDNAVFRRVDFANLLKLNDFLGTERPAVESVVILDDSFAVVPSGFFTKRRGDSIGELRKLLQERVIGDLGLERLEFERRGHLHAYYDGRPYLFSYIKRAAGERVYYVVLEADLGYLVSTIFQQYFAVRSPRLYQVVDSAGEVVYGFDFAGLPEESVVEIPFSETVDRWRLRVAQPEAAALTGRSSRQKVDLVFIGSALIVILVGLSGVLLGLQRERRANELKSEFISNVSHELKTPLSIISMFGEMLALGRTRSSAQATEYAEIIWRESLRLARLIDNVLDFAKIERGVDVYEFAEGDPVEVVDRSVTLSAQRMQGADMTLDVEVDPEVPMLSMDAGALTLAILNLLDNAVKYAAAGRRVELRLQRRDRRVIIMVRDFGPGIAAEEQGRIFDRFYRARAVRLQPIRGSGIGLSLVKHIAQAHGGDVEVESGLGRGTTFRMWIPIPAGG
ncbi:sensor histidine kinase [Haliangium sp.]|uniref:sensor histidine kinase n=1 Tax=Haliangium sp. TaxID=2663208 RepID=UPI003D0EF0F1